MSLTRPRVLVVDDDPVVREVVLTVLDDGDCDLSEAADGIEAVRLAIAGKPDVVVLDVMMPGMTGFEVCRRIREDPALSGIIVVLLTALDSTLAREEGDRAGADLYLTKPFSALDLLGAVSQAVSRAAR